jgi:argonaute-like protein implicated in RNA metabolism and viral defense
MSQIRTIMKEQNGTLLEAKIMKSEHMPYSIEYFINGKYVQTETFAGHSLYYVESAAENWLAGIKVLNG